MDTEEKMGDIIYETLKANGIREDRAFITDIVSVALYKDGYHKLPGKPPLLSDEGLEELGVAKERGMKSLGKMLIFICGGGALIYIVLILLVVFVSWVFGFEPENYPWGMLPQSDWKFGIP